MLKEFVYVLAERAKVKWTNK